MKKLTQGITIVIAAASVATVARSQVPTEPVDLATISAIRDEGLRHSQVMDTVSWLADVYGPRLTGIPRCARPRDWAQKRMASNGD